MNTSRTRTYRMLVALGAGIVVLIGMAVGPADAAIGERVPVGSDFTERRLITQSGVAFLPSDSGNPINSAGRVAGSTVVAGTGRAAVFTLQTNRLQVLSAFPGQRTEATDINNRGEVSGTLYAAGGGSRAFLWSTATGQVRLLPLGRGTASVSIALNDHGVVLGSVRDTDWTPIVWDVGAGTSSRLVALDDAQAINNRGWVAGTMLYREFSRARRPVVWRPGQPLVVLPFLPGDDSTLVTGINDRGEVIGTSMNVEAEDELFGVPVVWTVAGRRILCELARPGALDTPYAIDDRGRIVGGYLTAGSDESRPYRAVTWAGCGSPPVTLPAFPAAAFGVNQRQIVGHVDLFLPTVTGVVWTRN